MGSNPVFSFKHLNEVGITVKAGIKTSFGYNLMYYIEDGLPSALGRTQSQTTSEDFGTMYQELQKNYPITTNENELLNFDSSLKA